MEELLKQAKLNKSIRNHCKRNVDAYISIYKEGLIGFGEFVEGVAQHEELYKRALKVEKSLILMTPAYSNERYILLDELY